MQFIPAPLEGVILVEPDVYRDERGFFLETYHREKYAGGGIDAMFMQDNHSRSAGGTLRGLHAQLRRPQGKLVRAVEGEIWDVAVDIRRGSPSFGKWVGFALSEQNFRQLYVPAGYAHGFCVLSEAAQVEYKCTELYDSTDELALAWDDADLAIEWPIRNPLLSPRDRAAPRLREVLELLPTYCGGPRRPH